MHDRPPLLDAELEPLEPEGPPEPELDPPEDPDALEGTLGPEDDAVPLELDPLWLPEEDEPPSSSDPPSSPQGGATRDPPHVVPTNRTSNPHAGDRSCIVASVALLSRATVRCIAAISRLSSR